MQLYGGLSHTGAEGLSCSSLKARTANLRDVMKMEYRIVVRVVSA